MLDRGFQDARPRHHHPKVDYFKAIALKHDAHDIFADIMHVAFDSRHDDLAFALGASLFLRLNVGEQMRDRLFHDARRLHHLRQEHPPRSEQVTNDIHAVHQRPFDNFNWPAACYLDRKACFFGIIDNMRIDALNQCMFKPLADWPAAPFCFGLFLRNIGPAIGFGQSNQALGGIWIAIENDVFASQTEHWVDLVIDI